MKNLNICIAGLGNVGSHLVTTIQENNKLLLKYWETNPPYIISSSKKKIGRNEILHEIDMMNKMNSTEI